VVAAIVSSKETGRGTRKRTALLSGPPGFTLFAVCGLALAIGANTFVFTIVNAALRFEEHYAQKRRIEVERVAVAPV
jgi:hypothetical protein